MASPWGEAVSVADWWGVKQPSYPIQPSCPFTNAFYVISLPKTSFGRNATPHPPRYARHLLLEEKAYPHLPTILRFPLPTSNFPLHNINTVGKPLLFSSPLCLHVINSQFSILNSQFFNHCSLPFILTPYPFIIPNSNYKNVFCAKWLYTARKQLLICTLILVKFHQKISCLFNGFVLKYHYEHRCVHIALYIDA